MRPSDLEWLQCVECGGSLALEQRDGDGGEVLDGLVSCSECKTVYPVIRGVGVFFLKSQVMSYLTPPEIGRLKEKGLWDRVASMAPEEGSADRAQVAVARNWEYHWDEVFPYRLEELSGNTLFGPDKFWTFVPLARESVRGKAVFIACGGRGREAWHVSAQGPERVLVNEIGACIYAIRDLFSGRGDVPCLIRSDLNHHPVRDGACDVAICDHGLQHVLNHRRAYGRLAGVVKPGGKVVVCVYSHENNAIMTRFIEPMKKVFHRFPLKGQRVLSWPMAAVLFAGIQGGYRPLSTLAPALAEKLPLYEHMMFWSTHPFDMVWSSCFDLVHAPISHHFRKREVEGLAREYGLTVTKMINTHGTMWSMVAEKPGA